MKKNTPIFEGAGTALITPTTETSVDFEKLGKLIDWQIEEGISALVVCGTSGESSTLTDEEHKSVIAYSAERAAGRVPVIAGIGSNETNYSIELAKFSHEHGADASLCVTPYYNKCTQKGLIKSYYAIADAAPLPMILYNVPSRTSVNIEPSTYAELAKHENIVAVKEANSNISKIVEACALCDSTLDFYSGNDDQVVPLMAMGYKGVISVLSNIYPKGVQELCQRMLKGDMGGAAELQRKYHNIISALFCEVNPIPVKAACAAMGFCDNFVRLPLTQMEDGHYQTLLSEMRKLGLEV